MKPASDTPFLLDPVARGFVRTMGTFGIGVGLGLAPFLGEIQVAHVHPLLQIFPTKLKLILLVIAPLMLGSVAVAVRFYLGERIARAGLRRWFAISLAGVLFGLVALVIIHNSYVVSVPMAAGDSLEIIGSRRIDNCGCGTRQGGKDEKGRDWVDDELCIPGLAFQLGACWNVREMKNIQLAYKLVYLFVNLGFGAAVGILMLQKDLLTREGPQQTPESTSAHESET